MRSEGSGAFGHLLFFVALAAAAACRPGDPPAPSFQPIGGVKITMSAVLEPAAEIVWDSAGTIIAPEGTQELAPTTDEGWERVYHGAAVVAEAGNLLLMPGRRMPGEDWAESAADLTRVGRRAMAAADARDPDALFEVGGELYEVCVSCHQLYWSEGSSRVGGLDASP